MLKMNGSDLARMLIGMSCCLEGKFSLMKKNSGACTKTSNFGSTAGLLALVEAIVLSKELGHL